MSCAAETKQDCVDSDALSADADCVGSELDGRPLAEERTTFFAVGWGSGWLADGGFTSRWVWVCEGLVGWLPAAGMVSTVVAGKEAVGVSEAVAVTEAVGVSDAVAVAEAVGVVDAGAVVDEFVVVEGLPAIKSQPTAPATTRIASMARGATSRRWGANRCFSRLAGLATSTK